MIWPAYDGDDDDDNIYSGRVVELVWSSCNNDEDDVQLPPNWTTDIVLCANTLTILSWTQGTSPLSASINTDTQILMHMHKIQTIV